jgi:uncharacterized protein (TIGR00369 family)
VSEPRTRSYQWPDPAQFAARLSGHSGLEFLRTMVEAGASQVPIACTLGFRLTAVEPGFARFEAEVAEFQFNPMGVVHGGMACTLLDSALGCAVMSTCDAQTAYTTAQLNVNLTRPITLATGRMIAEAKVVHRGSRIATAEGKLLDPQGVLLAHATTTCALFPRPVIAQGARVP